jgi:hypothetical protein
MDSIALFIDVWNKEPHMAYGFDYISSYIPIIYKGQYVGKYKALFKLNGEFF